MIFLIKNKKTGEIIWKKPLIDGQRLCSIDYIKQNGKTVLAIELLSSSVFGEQYYKYEFFSNENDGFILETDMEESNES